MIEIKSSAPGLDPRGDIEFDEYERNEFVARFLAVFTADLTEEEECAKVYEVHQQICSRADLYIAVAANLSAAQRRALHAYAQCRGDLAALREMRNRLRFNL